MFGTRCAARIVAGRRHLNRSLLRGFSSYSDEDYDDSRQKVALVLGSSGCLGSAVVQHLGQHLEMRVIGADVISPTDDTYATLDGYIQLPTFSHPAAVSDLTGALMEGLSRELDSDEEIDAIICAAGGWMGDPPLPKPDASDEDFMQGAREYGATINSMLEMNLYPVLAAGYAANRFMADEGGCTKLTLLRNGIILY